MIAVDTNVVVRLIVRDDARQVEAAEALFHQHILLSHTVLMETEWVLRSSYRLSRQAIETAFRALVSLGNVNVPFRDQIEWALDRYAAGADWADMLHLISARGAQAFASFERRLSNAAGPETPVKVLLLK